MALNTVAEFVEQTRVLLQDTVADYRYPTNEIIMALNMGLLEARRLRPDLFIETATEIPSYETDGTDDNTAVAIDQQYRMGLLYYMVGMINLRDEEDTQDARAAALMNKFTTQLLAIA